MAGRDDYPPMACERWREMLSAQMDGEDDPADRPLVDEHLAGCAGCRQWLDRAATVNRLTRTGLATAVPDLSAAILAAAPRPQPPETDHQGAAVRRAGRRRRGAAHPRADPGRWRRVRRARAHRPGRHPRASVARVGGLERGGGRRIPLHRAAPEPAVRTGADADRLRRDAAAAVRQRPLGRPGRRHQAGQPRLRDRRISAGGRAVPDHRRHRPQPPGSTGVGLARGLHRRIRRPSRETGCGWCHAGR